MKKLILFGGLFLLLACSARNSGNDSNPVSGNGQDDDPVFEIIMPNEFGGDIITDQGTFKDARFYNRDTHDVWAVFLTENGERKRLNLELDFGDSLQFLMYTDKFLDQQNLGNISVYTGVRQNTATIENIQIAALADDTSEVFAERFAYIDPYPEYDIVETSDGPFIEAFFADLNTEDVWAMFKTLPQGTRLRVNISRRINRPLYYYLKSDVRLDSLGHLLSGITVGLPYDELSPLNKIQVLIQR